MLPEEAQWIAAQLQGLGPRRVSPLVNLGSGNRRFRDEEQPFIGAMWRSFEREGGHVLHVDIRAQDGVDIVGDLHDPAMQARLRALGPAAVLASNLLEHVADPKEMVRLIASLVPAGGFLVLTGPQVFPYHPDPIDNGLRLSPEEAAALLPELTVVAKASIASPEHVRGQREAQQRLRPGRKVLQRLWYAKEFVRSPTSRRVLASRWRLRKQVPSAFAVVLRREA